MMMHTTAITVEAREERVKEQLQRILVVELGEASVRNMFNSDSGLIP
jgi:hypothetical protein